MRDLPSVLFAFGRFGWLHVAGCKSDNTCMYVPQVQECREVNCWVCVARVTRCSMFGRVGGCAAVTPTLDAVIRSSFAFAWSSPCLARFFFACGESVVLVAVVRVAALSSVLSF